MNVSKYFTIRRAKIFSMDDERKNFGRPMKKASRIGQKGKPNKNGHRKNKHSK